MTNAKPTSTIFHGDCLELLRTLDDNSVDAVVTDPPAGISFMGKDWDGDRGGRHVWIAWMRDVMQECMRVVRPGGHALVWALPRTSHWTACALEDAGWEIRDCLYHIFGSGFPKSLDVSKAIDKAAGAEREVVNVRKQQGNHGYQVYTDTWNDDGNGRTAHGRDSVKVKRNLARETFDITAPATDAAREWDGWGTALKPAVENWWLVRKPLAAGNVAANVLTYGTGAINVDACRVEGVPPSVPQPTFKSAIGMVYNFKTGEGRNGEMSHAAGRWPANLLLSHAADCTQAQCVPWCPAAVLDAQSGERGTGHFPRSGGTKQIWGKGKNPSLLDQCNSGYGDTGGASRYFAQFYHDGTTDCLLCRKHDTMNAKQQAGGISCGVTSAVLSSNQCDVASNTVRDPALARRRRGSADSKASKNAPANNAVSPSSPSPATIDATAPMNVDGLHVAQIAHAVKCAVSLCDSCATAIAQSLAPMLRDHFQASSHGADYTDESITSILSRNRAPIVEHLESIGITPTIANLITSFGFASVATEDITRTASSAQHGVFVPTPFLYSSKASRRERNAGLDGLPERLAGPGDMRASGDFNQRLHQDGRQPVTGANHHPTVKPLSLMRWLCRLVTPAGGTVLDPFGGSGSTAVAAIAEGFNVIVMEREADYLPIIHARTAYAAERLYTPSPVVAVAPVVAPVMPAKPQRRAARRTQATIPDGQLTLWEVEGTPA